MAATARKSRRGRRTEAGTAAIEFGLAIPLLLIILMGVAELGFAMYGKMQVYNSVEAGALYVAKNGFDQAGIADAVVNATGMEHIAATPAPVEFYGCPGDAGIVVTAPTATCNDGKPAGQYVRISASVPRWIILPYPALGLPPTLTAQSVIRLN
ncbi:MAG: TadE/TadG family type IV pilus assembly protein [Pseudolabrys sp.]